MMGNITQLEHRLEFSKKLWDKLAVILAKRSKRTPDEIKAKCKNYDWWLDAQEAVDLGFADEIG
jgi:ATP-dependent protease ClpP protease subunit